MSEQVREMFSSIATRYDVANIVLSFGVDRWWRHIAVKSAGIEYAAVVPLDAELPASVVETAR